jgi:hypothetical protein
MTAKWIASLSSALVVIAAGCTTQSGPAPGSASSVTLASCGAATVPSSASAGQVLAACGQPTYRDAWGAAAAAQGPNLASVEEWYYNAGAQQPIQVLRFLNGQLIAVNNDGYGFDVQSPGSCDRQTINAGLSKYRLLHLCGQPLTRQAYIVDPSFITPDAPVLSQGNALIVGQSQSAQPVYREDLAYQIGGAVQTVTLQNGRVLAVADPGRRG